MNLYLDASAAVKLIIAETESIALGQYLDASGAPLLMSAAILETELRRMANREGLDQGMVSDCLAQIALIYPERSDFFDAGVIPVPGLRTLDSLHLVTAMRAEADLMVAYDSRLISGCHIVGLPTISPA